MKYIWEAQDIKAGRKVDAHNRSEKYIIGYDPKCQGHDNYAVISLVDGMITTSGHTDEELAKWLSESKSRPLDIDLEDHIPPERKR